MAHQLALIDDTPREWVLDDHTRELGREGLRMARQILAAIPSPSEEPVEEPTSLSLVLGAIKSQDDGLQTPKSGSSGDSAHQTAA